MKKVIVLFVAAAVVCFSSCGAGKAGAPKTESDSLAYALGVHDIALFIKNTDSMMDINMLMAGAMDQMKGNAKMSTEDALAFLQEYFTVRMPAKAKAAGEEYLAGIEKNNPNIKKTESGILYEIIEEGGEKPGPTDMVRVNYLGKLKNDVEFDSSYKRGDTAQFGLNQVIGGWSEGIQLVGKGGKIKLWIPSELAYKETGFGGAIGPNEPLYFEVELIDIIPAEEPAQAAN